MGCGKSKYDVVSGSTVFQRKKSSVKSKEDQENGTETVDKCNGVVNFDNACSHVKHENNENVKEVEVIKGKGEDVSNDVKDFKALEKSAVENKTEEIVVTEKSEPGKEDDSLEKKENKVIDHYASATAEEKKAENGKEDVSLREESLVKEEETKYANDQEETLVKEEKTKATNHQEKALVKEEETKDTNQEKDLTKEEKSKDADVSTSEGEQKDLKVVQGQ